MIMVRGGARCSPLAQNRGLMSTMVEYTDRECRKLYPSVRLITSISGISDAFAKRRGKEFEVVQTWVREN